MSNPLTDVLTPTIRKYLYAALFLAGVVLGALKILGHDVGDYPEVLAYIGAALGLTAASNVTPSDAPEVPGD